MIGTFLFGKLRVYWLRDSVLHTSTDSSKARLSSIPPYFRAHWRGGDQPFPLCRLMLHNLARVTRPKGLESPTRRSEERYWTIRKAATEASLLDPVRFCLSSSVLLST